MTKIVQVVCVLMIAFQARSFSQSSNTTLPSKGLCAHRGAMDSHPENTLPAFKEAINLGAHMIEFDIQLTKDGELIIMHDSSVNRTTNGSGPVAQLTLSEIKKFDAGVKKDAKFKGTAIPTFQETLDIMPTNVWLNCHLKGGAGVGEAAAKMLEKHGRLNQAFLACGEEAAATARTAVPTVLICNSENRYRKNTDVYVNATIAMKADFIQLVVAPEEDRSTAIRSLKNRGIKINYYLAKSPDELADLFNSGLDFILVNNLSEMMPKALQLGIKPVKH